MISKTLDEFTSFIKKGGIHPDSVPLPVKNSTIVSVMSLPTSIDWRTKNVIQSIKDQGLCGSCWAFASVSALESYVSLATGQSLNLSEQNLVDCTYSRDGCLGGLDPNAFNYVLSNNGIATQTNYPYVSGITGQVSINKSFILILK